MLSTFSSTKNASYGQPLVSVGKMGQLGMEGNSGIGSTWSTPTNNFLRGWESKDKKSQNLPCQKTRKLLTANSPLLKVEALRLNVMGTCSTTELQA